MIRSSKIRSSRRMLATTVVISMVGCGLPQWPVEGPLIAPFGLRWGSNGPNIHRGVDIIVPTGTPVYAMSGGEIRFAGEMTDFGLVVWVDHDDAILTIYAHLSQILVVGARASGKVSHWVSAELRGTQRDRICTSRSGVAAARSTRWPCLEVRPDPEACGPLPLRT